MKTLIVSFLTCACTLITISAVTAAELNMKEGLWEITSKTEMPGMPISMPPTVNSQCLTKDDFVPKGQNQNPQECKMIESHISSDTVTWTMSCSQGGMTTKMTGKVAYKGTTFDGTMKVENNAMPGGVMNITMTGKRIGKCN